MPSGRQQRRGAWGVGRTCWTGFSTFGRYPRLQSHVRLIFHNITTHGDNGPAHRKMSDWISPMTATVTPVHRGETSSRARFPKASFAHHCQALSSCHVELVNSTDLTPISWRIGVKNVNTAIFTTLHLCEFSCDNQKKYCGRHFPLELHDAKVWG